MIAPTNECLAGAAPARVGRNGPGVEKAEGDRKNLEKQLPHPIGNPRSKH